MIIFDILTKSGDPDFMIELNVELTVCSFGELLIFEEHP